MPVVTALRRPRTLTGRLLVVLGATLIAVLLVLGLVLERSLERYFVGQLTESLTSEARVVESSIGDRASIQRQVIRLGRTIGARVTVIRTDGVVLADSERDPATMSNHRDRPEVRAALRGAVGISSRLSATVGTAFRYVALPAHNGRIVRVALPLTTVESKLRTVRWILGMGFGVAAIIGLAALGVTARRLLRPLRDITKAVVQSTDAKTASPVPERGTEELALLGRTLNRTRQEVEARILDLEEEQRTRDAILSSLEEGVMLCDRDGTVLYRNDQAMDLLHAPRDGVSVLPPAIRSVVAQSQSHLGAVISESALGGDRRTLQILAVPIAERDQILVVLRDVTDARRAETVRREFVANASHELKTPVASLQALAETIGQTIQKEPGATSRFAERLELEAVRLSRLVADLLDLSRLEGEPGEQTEVDLRAVVSEEVSRRVEAAKKAGLSVSLMNDSEDVRVLGNASELSLLVHNLLDNAIQYTDAGGMIDVALNRSDGQAVLVVKDTGIGIPSRDQSRIFERFYRVDRARSRQTGGTGLGLSIAKHVAENHDGSVSVESELGNGARFTVRLPLLQRRTH